MKLKDIVKYAKFSKNNLTNLDLETQIHSFEIDSRKVEENSIFIALKGKNVNGEDFVNDILNNNAYAIVSKNFDFNKIVNKEKIHRILIHENPVLALKLIAKNHIKNINAKIIAVSGSVAKTSTKDLIYSVLSSEFKVKKSIGNFNNEIGLPLMALKIDENDDFCVLELGIDKASDMEYYCDITNHNIGILTCIGSSHIGNFKNKDELFLSKLKIDECIDENGFLVINANDNYLKKIVSKKDEDFQKLDEITKKNIINESLTDLKKYEILRVGKKNINQKLFVSYDRVNINEFETKFDLYIKDKKYNVSIPLIGEFNCINLLFAVAIAKKFGISDEKIIKSFENLKTSNMRFQIEKISENLSIINDCYNCALESIKMSILALNSLKGNKLVILGDILECGNETKNIHEDVGKFISEYDLDVIFIGENMKYALKKYEQISKQKKVRYYKTKLEFFEAFEKDKIYELTQKYNLILVKASRGMEFEKIVNYLKK